METQQLEHTAERAGKEHRQSETTRQTNRQWRLVHRPNGMFSESDFEFASVPVPELANGQFLIRITHVSADPTQLIWATRENYMSIQPLGEVMRAGGIGIVEQSRHPGFAEGTKVSGLFGVQSYMVSDGQMVDVVPPDVAPEAALAVLGFIGITAYFGVMDIARLAPGETLVVSGAAGAVGSLAGQIGKIVGARVVGIAGTDEKCDWVRNELGFDSAINYRKDLEAGLDQYCPSGIDAYFDNTGGPILEAVLRRINLRARVALCGMISDYTRGQGLPITNLAQLIMRRARIEGFLCFDYFPRAAEAMDALGTWLAQGRLKYRVDRVQGLENAISGMNRLFKGANTGKVIITV